MYGVAVTGIGIVSSLGTGAEDVREALREGRSGVGVDAERQKLGFRSPLTGVIDAFEPPPLGRKQRRTISDYGLQAYAAALEAIQGAGWDESLVRNPQTGLIVGNDSSALANVAQADTTRREGRTLPIGAGMVFHTLTSTVTMNLNALLGCRGASWTISGACASGGHAVGQASDLIAVGRQERVLCGGVQEINWESQASFDATNAFSTRVGDPEGASRPFDSERDGLVPSGGAAMLALERLDSARERGARILGTIQAYTFSSDGMNLAVPSGDGLAAAMTECLERAQVQADAVDCIAAHATSTPVGDLAEARAIAQVFGEATGDNDGKQPWISALKSLTGHEMWMAGASQIVYTLLMAHGGFIAPNRNFSGQEPDAPRLRIRAGIVEEQPRVILCNSAGFGGTNSCLLLSLDGSDAV